MLVPGPDDTPTCWLSPAPEPSRPQGLFSPGLADPQEASACGLAGPAAGHLARCRVWTKSYSFDLLPDNPTAVGSLRSESEPLRLYMTNPVMKESNFFF